MSRGNTKETVGSYREERTCEHTEGGHLQAKEASEEIKPANALILDFYPPFVGK